MEDILIEQIVSNPNNGKPIPPQVKNELETRFNANLSNYKVYTGPEARMILNIMGAAALVKDNVVIIESEFDTSTLREALIRHESAHQARPNEGINSI